jgi:hypothetical protein
MAALLFKVRSIAVTCCSCLTLLPVPVHIASQCVAAHPGAASLILQVGLLTLKTAAKPLASRFEKLVLNHPVWRARVIEMAQVGPARFGSSHVCFKAMCKPLHDMSGMTSHCSVMS